VVSSGENLNIKLACFKDQRGLKISYTNAPAFSGKSTAIYSQDVKRQGYLENSADAKMESEQKKLAIFHH